VAPLTAREDQQRRLGNSVGYYLGGKIEMSHRGHRTELLRQRIKGMLAEGYTSEEIKASMTATTGMQPGQESALERLKPPPPLRKVPDPAKPRPLMPPLYGDLSHDPSRTRRTRLYKKNREAGEVTPTCGPAERVVGGEE